MKVLQVSAYAAPYEGNFILSLKRLEAKLKEKGLETIYAFPETAKEKDWCKQLEKTNKVYYLPLKRARLRPKTYRLLKKIYKENTDLKIIHCHFELYDIPVILTAKKHMQVFWHLHDAIDVFTDFHNRFMYKLQYKFLHKKAKVLAVSNKLKEYVKKLGFPSKQAFYVPNGLNLDRINQVDSTIEKDYDYLMFGWLYHVKGVDLLAQAMKRTEHKIKVAIVGKEGTKEVFEKDFGQIDGVNVIPAVKDVNELYNKTRYFLHISRHEGLSYALLEAVYAGLIVICSDIEENMFAKEFPSCYMVESENVEEIKNAMETLFTTKEEFIEKVDESRKIIEEKYSLDCWVNTILDFYGI